MDPQLIFEADPSYLLPYNCWDHKLINLETSLFENKIIEKIQVVLMLCVTVTMDIYYGKLLSVKKGLASYWNNHLSGMQEFCIIKMYIGPKILLVYKHLPN